jgi:hypothetical protein
LASFEKPRSTGLRLETRDRLVVDLGVLAPLGGLRERLRAAAELHERVLGAGRDGAGVLPGADGSPLS